LLPSGSEEIETLNFSSLGISIVFGAFTVIVITLSGGVGQANAISLPLVAELNDGMGRLPRS